MWHFPLAGRPALVRLLLVAVAGVSLAGCRPGSALHSRYNNFRAYYNTYYNATRSLEEGELALERAAVTVDRSRLVPVFPETAGAGATTGPFQDAIDKSAELLRNRPDSKWADDALLLIGKAYFYQRNLAGAEQKFRETMAAAERSRDRRLGDEARFWLGRTYAASNRFDEGVGVLEDGLADEGGDRRWTARMRLALGELYARAGRWDEAARALRDGAPDEGDADVAARAYVLLGQIEEHAERWDAAADAYQLALDRRPAYELSFAALVGRALVLGVDAGRSDEAIQIVRRMRGDDKNFDRRGELAMLEARLRAAAGETQQAQALFGQVLYDAELQTPEAVKGQAHYRLAEFYRDALGDYVRASAHFDTAATTLRTPETALRASRDAILDVSDEARTYSVLASAARRIRAADSLLALGDLDEDAFRARIASIEAERTRVYRQEQRRLAELEVAQRFQTGGGGAFGDQPGSTGFQGPQSAVRTPGSTAPSASAGGFLSFRDPASVQAGQVAFAQRWGDRPLVPNWRRRAAVQAGDIASGRGTVSRTVQGGLELGQGPPPLDLNAVPRTPAKRNELITELSGLRYELANAFFLSLGRADTAAVLYRAILSETPDLPVAVRARYALAEIERAAGRDDVARPLYESVAAADTSALGRSSRLRLGLETEEVGAGPVETSAAYDAARSRWRGGDPLGGAEALVAVGDARPDAAVAPRAYLAAAAAYLDWAGADSLARSAPLPDRLVSRVLLETAVSGQARPPVPPVPGEPDPLGDDEEDEAEETPAGPGRTDPESGRPRRAPRQALGGVEGLQPARQAEPAPRPQARPLVADVGYLPVPDSASFTLRHHLAAVATRYPGTPYAERALLLATALPIPPVPSPDSTTAPAPSAGDSMSTPTDAAAATDSTLVESSPAGPPAAVPSGLLGDAPPDPSGGGYAWRVQRATIAEEGEALTGVLRASGFRAATMRDGDGVVVVVGQFETEAQAEASRAELPAWAQLRGEIVALDGLLSVSTAAPDRDDL